MNQPDQPNQSDLVLGQQNPPPINSAVLGGTQGFKQRFATQDSTQRITVLAEAIAHQPPDIDLIIEALSTDSALQVRGAAYDHLSKLLESTDRAFSDELLAKIRQAIAPGIKLNPGDEIYCVYKSAINYNDEWFNLESGWNAEIMDTDWEEIGYESYEDFCNSDDDYGGGELSSYIPKIFTKYLTRIDAEVAADRLHQEIIESWDYHDFEQNRNFKFTEWCQANCELYSCEYSYELAELLRQEQNYDLLAKLWKDSIGIFAFVHAETVTQSAYLLPPGAP
jgi:hypothetical protein